MSKTVIVITGPTAAGKTALAIKLAQHFNTAVISADSRQCYREISIGTAKPSPEELSAVPHYFIDSHSIAEEVNAAMFEKLTLQYAADIFSKTDTAIMCGGTGLYVRAFCEGMDDMPAIPPAIREAVRKGYEENGLAWLQHTLQQRDPAFYAIAETQNPVRLMRARRYWKLPVSPLQLSAPLPGSPATSISSRLVLLYLKNNCTTTSTAV
ncbi:hypothetical protein MKQ70_14700 [Chitinophaga sedimenti]|nr:isopentenyl transferase family protein [Chitinophaga sedimenti]MCK7556197.1 hypothetical protein [Chitinophaga sedimenti]